jgi:hypothetical protein
VLNGAGVFLQVRRVFAQLFILQLQLLQLRVQLVRFVALLFVDADAVLPEDDVIAERKREQRGRTLRRVV